MAVIARVRSHLSQLKSLALVGCYGELHSLRGVYSLVNSHISFGRT
jgi:hypothetical protein